MSNQTITLHKASNPEDCLVVPDYEKHLLDKKCRYCGVGHMKQKTLDGLYHQLHERMDGKHCCDGDDCLMTELISLKNSI
jgi:hypothetical protein